MSLPEYSLRNSKVVGFFLAVLVLGGLWGFVRMGKKEDSTFVIKSAVITVVYPGATPLEVEQPPRISAFGETRSLSEVVIHLVPRKSKPPVRNTAP